MLAANPLISVTPGLMIWTIVCFLITLYVLKRFAFGPIQSMIDERQARIRSSIEEADNDRQRRLEETHRQVEAETRRALEQIRQEVADLTLIAATKVTGKALTAD